MCTRCAVGTLSLSSGKVLSALDDPELLGHYPNADPDSAPESCRVHRGLGQRERRTNQRFSRVRARLSTLQRSSTPISPPTPVSMPRWSPWRIPHHFSSNRDNSRYTMSMFSHCSPQSFNVLSHWPRRVDSLSVQVHRATYASLIQLLARHPSVCREWMRSLCRGYDLRHSGGFAGCAVAG